MKPRHLVAFAVLAVIAGAFVAGCGLLGGTSIDVRIGDFVSSLNGDRTQTYTNLVSGSAAYTANQGQTALWDTHFPTADGTYTESITSATPYDAVGGVLVDITPSGTGIVKHCKITLTNTGSISEDWFIADIQVQTGGTYVSIFQ
jgi:hypothetical protein